MLTKVTGISLVIFPVIEIKYLDKKQHKREWVYYGSQFKCMSHWIFSQEAKNDKPLCSAS